MFEKLKDFHRVMAVMDQDGNLLSYFGFKHKLYSTNQLMKSNIQNKNSFRFYKRLNFHWAIFKIRYHDKQWTDLLILLLQNITLKCGKIIEFMTMNSLILDWMTHFFFNLGFKLDSLPPKICIECEVLNSSFFLVNINIRF